MLLQQIVEVLDAELDRLTEIRSVVSSLQTTTEPTELADLEAATEQVVTAPLALVESLQLPVKAKGGRVAGMPRARAPRRAGFKAEAKALTSSIPAGPVVVPRAALAKEKAAKGDSPTAARAREPKPAPGSLGSMIRALHLDRP